MWLDHADKTHATFWQQMFRYLVTDTPGQVTSTTPKQVLADDTRVPIRVEVRDKEYKPVANAKVQARFMVAGWLQRHRGADAATAGRGRLHGRMDGRKARLVRGRDHRRPRAGGDRARRAHLPPRGRRGRKFPYLAESRAARKAVASRPAAGTTRPTEASKLASEISYSEAGITTRETRDLWDMPIVFLLVLGLRASGMAAAPQVGGGMKRMAGRAAGSARRAAARPPPLSI